MIKKLILLFILFPVIGFGQNINSKAGDWYFFYEENAKLIFDKFNSTRNPIIDYTNLTSLVESRDSINNKLEIKLRPTLRNYGDNYSVVSRGEWEDYYARPSILGEKLIFAQDSLFVQIEENRYLVFPSFNFKMSYPFFKNDSLEIQANIINQKIGFINGYEDSMITIKLKAIKGFQLKESTLINNTFLTYGKQSGFIENPDFFQLNKVFEVSKIDNYFLKFSNNPLIGIKSLQKKNFYDYSIDDLYYYDGFPLFQHGGFMRIFTGIDSITNVQSTSFNFYEYSFHSVSYSGLITYFDGYKSITVMNNEMIKPPFCSVFVNDSTFEYSSGNIFYLKNRACFQYKNDIPFINDNSMDSVFTFFENSIIDEHIICEDLGVVQDFIGEYGGGWSTERGFVLRDYKKGSEVLTGLANEIYLKSKPESFISPNPASGYFKIDLKEKVTLVEIFNGKGQRLKVFNHSSSSNYSISDIPSGIYFVKIHTSDNEFTEKLIIE